MKQTHNPYLIKNFMEDWFRFSKTNKRLSANGITRLTAKGNKLYSYTTLIGVIDRPNGILISVKPVRTKVKTTDNHIKNMVKYWSQPEDTHIVVDTIPYTEEKLAINIRLAITRLEAYITKQARGKDCTYEVDKLQQRIKRLQDYLKREDNVFQLQPTGLSTVLFHYFAILLNEFNALSTEKGAAETAERTKLRATILMKRNRSK